MRVSASAVPAPPRDPLAELLAAEVASARWPGDSYRVVLYGDGSWGCPCPAFRYGSRADRLCRHTDHVRDALERIQALAFLLR
jgi:hypothetical protein